MAKGTIQVTLFGLEDVQEQVRALLVATNTEDILDASGAVVLNRIRDRFLRQEATDGSQWQESKAAALRKRSGRGGGTLFDSGNLFQSISLGKDGKDRRRIFSPVEYGEKHQFGLEGNPVREFLGFSDEDEIAVRLVIDKRIQDALR